jgi:hypothetical protein
MSWESISPQKGIMYTNFVTHASRYQEVELTTPELLALCNRFLDEHNRESSKQLDIVLFSEAIDHLASLSRILLLPKGHAMLIGMKSSGRKSLGRLSLHMAGISGFEIAVTKLYSFDDWRNDMKLMMKQCGIQDQQTCLLISDAQIIVPF